MAHDEAVTLSVSITETHGSRSFFSVVLSPLRSRFNVVVL